MAPPFLALGGREWEAYDFPRVWNLLLPDPTILTPLHFVSVSSTLTLADRIQLSQAIPFLQFLLEGSAEELGQAPEGVSGSGGGTLAPSSSTFLCIHLAGNVASPLFEVACRALFRLRARKLPRFVERLARFRAYAAAMTSDANVEENSGSGGGGDSVDEGDVRQQRRRERRHERIPSDVRSETTGDAGAPVKVAATVLSARRGSSTASAEDRTDEYLTTALRSRSPPPSPSRRASDDSTSASGDILGLSLIHI